MLVDGSHMSEERFRSLVEAYGADPARWPAAERHAAERLLGASAAARAAAAEADRLDLVMSAARRAAVPDELEARLMADFERVTRRWSPRKVTAWVAEAVWPGAPLWQPACALGLALAIGVGVAAFVPLDVRRGDEPAGSAFALDTPPDIDAGQDI